MIYGTNGNFQEYQGSRSFSALKSFVESHKGDANAAPSPDAHMPACNATSITNVKLNNGVEMRMLHQAQMPTCLR